MVKNIPTSAETERSGCKDHTTLVAAVKAAGLVDTLAAPGQFTVFEQFVTGAHDVEA